jgi:serine/threonine protein kinase
MEHYLCPNYSPFFLMNCIEPSSEVSPLNTEDCPNCRTTLDMTGVGAFSDASCPSCGQFFKACSRFNQFQITSLLGEGGMGSAFRAVDVTLDREVALKVLKIQGGNLHDEAEKLAHEARTTAQINHPNVVRIFDFGETRSQFYIAMELVGGGSLDDLMQQRGMVPEITALEVGIQVAQGLKAAMEMGLIHRDIKPANILFADRGTVKLVDFGLAVVASDTATSPTEIWGTPYYVAPEKLDDLPEDFRSDIYSLGGTLFHAMAGRPPYEADNASLVALKQLKSRPVSLQAFAPDVCNETAYVINRMMSKMPDKRYQSYDELIDHLRFALGKAKEIQFNPSAVRTSELRSLEGETQEMRWINLVFPVVVILGLLVFAYLYFFTTMFKTLE